MQWYLHCVSLRLIAKSWQGRHNAVRGLLRSVVVTLQNSGAVRDAMLRSRCLILSSVTGKSGSIHKRQQ